VLIPDRFGYSNSASQLLTVPIYAAAGECLFWYFSRRTTDFLKAMTMFIVAHFSDKMKLRSPFIVGLQAIALVGYAIELSNASAGVKYFGTYLCGIGVLGAFPSVICWWALFTNSYWDRKRWKRPHRLANNLEGKRKRAIGLALQNSVAVVSGIIASNIYRAKDDPRYIFGREGLSRRPLFSLAEWNWLDAISLGLLAVGFLATLSTALAYMRIIRNRNTLVEGEKNAQRGPTLWPVYVGHRLYPPLPSWVCWHWRVLKAWLHVLGLSTYFPVYTSSLLGASICFPSFVIMIPCKSQTTKICRFQLITQNF